MLHNTLRKKGAHEAVHVAHLHSDRVAKYASYSNFCGIHVHAEPNYRSTPMTKGFKAWGPPQQDCFAPFQQTTPRRHISKTFDSVWFAGGHIAMKPGFFGPLNWRVWRGFVMFNWIGVTLGMGTYLKRMYQNDWDWKNKGAVFGME